MHPSIGLLLLICAINCFADSNVVKLSEAEKNELVSMVNTERQRFAEERKIANMHEISWSTELEQKQGEMTCKNVEGKGHSGPNYIAAPFAHKSEMDAAELKNKNERTKSVGKLVFDHLYIPSQTNIACIKLKDTEMCHIRDHKRVGAVCLVGPIEDSKKEGEPGSQCPNGKSSIGLCQKSSSTNSVVSIVAILMIFLNFI